MSRSALRLIVVLALVVLINGKLQAQAIVNAYSPVVSIDVCRNELSVGDAALFKAGDRVLVIQMQGVKVDRSQTPSHGAVLAEGSCGNFEFATVRSVSSGRVRLDKRMVNTYDVSGAVQLVRVLSEASPDLTTRSITAKKWDGSTGGVVAIEATQSLNFGQTIDVTGCGFRGGAASSPLNGTDHSLTGYSWPIGSGMAGEKGESIVKYDDAHREGRGANGAGGGGGNASNTGGGGGANGGTGGKGGKQNSLYDAGDYAGLGGNAIGTGIWTSPLRALMGSGGGGGQQGDDNGSAGAAGGGIIIIRAKTITGNGTIIADGARALAAKDDGAGGGGAGGTIVLECSDTIHSLTFQVQGGDGGNVDASGISNLCFGPGGGGSGGRIFIGAPQPATIQIDVAGGVAGKTLTQGSACLNSSYGATDGADGSKASGITIPEGTVTASDPQVAAKSMTTCEGEPAQLSATGGVSYSWSPAATLTDPTKPDPIATPVKRTTYTVAITDANSCTFFDSVVVDVLPKPKAGVNGSLTACANQNSPYSASDATGSVYDWTVTGGTITTGQGTSNVSIAWGDITSGTVKLVERNANGCVDSTIATITATKPDASIAATTLVLKDETDQLTLSGQSGLSKYQWSSGEETKQIIVTQEGTYTLTVTDANGCTATSSPVVVTRLAGAKALVELSAIQAAVGDHIIVPISIRTSQNLPLANAISYTAKLRYNNTVLVPLVKLPVEVSGNESIITYLSDRGPDSIGKIGGIPFLVTLGDSKTSGLHLESFSWANTNRVVRDSIVDGSLTITNLCEGDVTRLFSPDGKILLTMSSPNPASDRTQVHYELLEPGRTDLFIIDLVGRRVMTVVDEDAAVGSFDRTINVSQLSDGRYFIILRTPSAVLRQPLAIQKH